MVGGEHRGSGTRRSSLAQLQRDAALHRLSHTRRWMILAATALTAAFAAVVSAIAPGKSLTARTPTGTPRSAATAAPSRASTQMPPLASAGDLGLQGPGQAPQSASAPSQASSDQSAAQAQAQADAQAQQSQAQAAAQAPAPAVSGGS